MQRHPSHRIYPACADAPSASWTPPARTLSQGCRSADTRHRSAAQSAEEATPHRRLRRGTDLGLHLASLGGLSRVWRNGTGGRDAHSLHVCQSNEAARQFSYTRPTPSYDSQNLALSYSTKKKTTLCRSVVGSINVCRERWCATSSGAGRWQAVGTAHKAVLVLFFFTASPSSPLAPAPCCSSTALSLP